MAGTRNGGLSAAETNRKRHEADFYARIGAIGSAKPKLGGFACQQVGADGLTGKERARIAGARGGRRNRRVKAGAR